MSATMSGMAVDDPNDPSVVALKFDLDAVAEDLARFCGGEAVNVDGYECVRVPTMSGIELARHGDWIVRICEGQFIAVTPDDFAARFEPCPAEMPI
jgi:hypothetical protein